MRIKAHESRVVLNYDGKPGLEAYYPGAIIREPDGQPDMMADTVNMDANGQPDEDCIALAKKAAPLASRIVITHGNTEFRGIYDAVMKVRVC